MMTCPMCGSNGCGCAADKAQEDSERALERWWERNE